MGALQTTFTSCRMGESGSAGFQFRSATPGVTGEERREIEALSGYSAPQRPRELGDPTIEEIEGSYPRMLRYQRLKSGRRALSLSCYVGQDYTGRWGNFFAHTLVLDVPPQHWPIDYYDWEGWSTRLTPEEDTPQKPSQLPPVDLTAVPASTSFTFEALRDFVRERPERATLLESMVRLVTSGLGTRRMVIRADFLDGLYWIACVQKLLPVSMMDAVTFSTWQYEERGCADVNLTLESGRFTFDEVNRERRFWMFDFTQGTHSRLPPAQDDYASRAIAWLLREPDARIEAFHRFARDFDLKEPSVELLSAARLFEASHGYGPQPTGAELSGILEFVSRRVVPEGYDRVLDLVLSLVNLSRATCGLSDRERLVGFFTDVASATRRPEHRVHAWRAWADLLADTAHRSAHSFARTIAVRQRIEVEHGVWSADLAAFFLSPEVQGELRDHVLPRGAEAWQRVLSEVLHQLRVLRRAPVTGQPEAMEWVMRIFRASPDDVVAHHLARAMEDDPRALADVALHLASIYHLYRDDDATWESLGVALGRQLQPLLAKDEGRAPPVRAALDVPAGHVVLLGEWMARCRPPDAVGAFRAYQRTVLRSLPGFERAMRPQILGVMEAALTPPQRHQVAWDLLQTGELASLPSEIQWKLIGALNEALVFRRNASRDLRMVEYLHKVATQANVSFRPDRIGLWHVLARISDPKDARPLVEIVVFQGLIPLVHALPAPEVGEFLSLFLAHVMTRTKLPQAHQVLLRGFEHSGLEAPLVHSLSEQLRVSALLPVQLRAVAAVWLATKPRQAPAGVAEHELAALRARLVDRLAELPEDEFAQVHGELLHDLASDPGGLSALEGVAAEFDRRSGSLLGKLGRVFKGRS